MSESILICVLVGEKKPSRCENKFLDFYFTCDPHEFCNWIANMDWYFDLFEGFDACRVRCAKDLIASTKICWATIGRQLERTYSRPIKMWDEMKEKLMDQFVLSSYRL